MRLRILNVDADSYSASAREVLCSIGEVIERTCSREELLRILPEFDVLIVRLRLQIDQQIISAGARLKAIVSATTGLDHIDVEYARSLGIEVLSLKGEVAFLRSIPATAEHTWGLMLVLTRNTIPASASVCAGKWNREAFRGHDLMGKRLGVVGLGRVGRRVARYGLAFDMLVSAYDPYQEDWVAGVAKIPALGPLLAGSDIITLHVPLSAETEGMIEAEQLVQLPKESYLINTSRGRIINEADLVSSLSTHHLAGAAVDVICDERHPKGLFTSPLWTYACSHSNLIITPHLGGATYESMEKTEIFMARKLAVALKAGPL